MALAFYDEDFNLVPASKIRAYLNGSLSDSFEKLLYIRNDNALKYYTNITLQLVAGDLTALRDDGWSIKTSKSERRPTELEWDAISHGHTLALDDVGETGTPSTAEYYPVWVRAYVPGGTAAQLRSDIELDLFFFERNV